jgi:outer membrane lipoprotein-sorting protein
MARSKQRWLPALLIPLALVAALLVGTLQAGAIPGLPPKPAEEILAMIARTEVRAFSGTVSQDSNLGLPDLSAVSQGAGPGSPSPLELLTGPHEARIYVDGPSKARLQILDRMAERDVILNGRDAWFYNSADNSAVHVMLPARPEDGGSPATPGGMAGSLADPGAIAARFLEAIDPHTEVTAGDPSTLAGRSAYTLILQPRSPETLVDRITISVDSETGFPLGVEVRAKDQADPAFSTSFSTFDPGVPDGALFIFTPPPGAAVSEKKAPALTPHPKASGSASSGSSDGSIHPLPGKAIFGEGWDSVLELPAAKAPAGLLANPQLAQALQPVPGGRALTSSLLSVLILDDGRVFAGTVPLDRLQAAADVHPAAG